MWATVRGLNAAGAVVKLELEAEHGPLQVELGRERYEALRPQLGERLFVRPQKVRVFVNPQ
jgi:hypothetical protein